MSKSTSNPSSSNSSDPPPPIPARRLVSHPSTNASSGKTDGASASASHQQQQGLVVKEKDVSESHSAPSSPTEKAKDGPKCDGSPSKVSPRHSSRSPNYQRPKSVVVDMTSGLNYAQVQFTNGHNVGGRPKAQQRRNTKYTSIAYQAENAADKSKKSKEATDGHTKSDGGQSKAQEQRQQTSPPSTASRNSDHHHRHHLQRGTSSPRSSPVPTSGDSAPMYDVPPPVPMRMDLLETNEGGVVGGGDKAGANTPPEVVHRRHSSDPFHGGATDPFDQDPFSSFSGGGAWDDPSAFYDKPPSRQPIPARSDPSGAATTTPTMSSTQANMGGNGGGASTLQSVDENAINSSDFTGESSYEDTFEVLKNLQMMRHSGEVDALDPYSPAAAVFMGGQDNKKSDGHHHLQQGRNEMSSPDLNQVNKDSYEFPTELAKYPLKKEGQATLPIENLPRCKEEPTLHTFNYSPKLPHNSAASLSTPSASVTRHESFNRSSRNMPLPPLPTEVPNQQQSSWPHPQQPVDHAPPLPARIVPNSSKPPLPGNHPSMRKPAAGAATEEQPPRLPPPNHPWGNKRHPGEPDSTANPPLPPRKKEGSSGVDMPAPQQQQQSLPLGKDELALRELIALGYSKAEIDRALKITRNDYSMAKMILQEFGGRH